MADTTTRSEPLLSEASQSFWEKHMFSLLLSVVHIALLFFYAFFTTTNPEEDYLERYGYLVGVTLMMFVGFGYLMTFLRWYGLGAVGLTMIITCLGLELAVLFEGIFFTTDGSKLVNIDLHALLNGDFAVAAFLISFGGLIGKVGPSQLVILVVCETFAYVANKQLILIRWLDIRDAGGTITIHMFGAYFGLAVALVIGKPAKMEKEKASISSDLTSLIGTTFLWLYWPSFVAGDLKSSEGAPLALVNTIISLIGSTVATFIVSPLLSNGKIRPVDVQNAALAGGVAIGAVANLDIKPFGALIIGSLAGVVSTVGFCKVQERLFLMGLHDTCGIHNLHGMPSLLGGLASVFTAVAGIQRAGTAGHQLAGIGLTLLTSICSGLLTGGLLLPFRAPSMNMADDSVHWEVADDFEACGMLRNQLVCRDVWRVSSILRAVPWFAQLRSPISCPTVLGVHVHSGEPKQTCIGKAGLCIRMVDATWRETYRHANAERVVAYLLAGLSLPLCIAARLVLCFPDTPVQIKPTRMNSRQAAVNFAFPD